jgi:hypothetical protein
MVTCTRSGSTGGFDPANVNINTWEARSANGGASWTSRRISTRSWNPNLGFFSSGAFIGGYNGIAVSRTNVYPVWTGGRNTAIAAAASAKPTSSPTSNPDNLPAWGGR